MMRKYSLKGIARLSVLFLLFLGQASQYSYAQSASFGNTFVASGGEMSIHSSTHSFINGGNGTLPGIISTERSATLGFGYFSFVGSSATYSGASDNAHVDGYVRTYLTSPFTFPIGDDNKYRPAAVSTAALTAPASAAYFAVNPATDGFSTTALSSGITGVSAVEYWDINGTTPARITLTWNAASNVSTLTVGQLNSLSIVGWNGNQWVRVASAVDATSLLGGASTLTSGSITTNAAFAPNTYLVYALGTSEGLDSDGDGIVDVDDPAPNDPCSPNPGSAACNSTARLSVKVLLQGALLNSATPGIMRDDLRSGNYIPLTDPYSGSSNVRFAHFGAGTTSTTTSSVLTTNAGSNDAIVDWVFVELRSSASSTTIVETRAALLQRDGDVVSPIDGTSPLLFPGLSGQQFFVAVKHRNHLGAMTANAISLSDTPTSVDFTTMANAAVFNNSGYDGAEMITVGTVKALWAGNANGDNRVQFQGSAAFLDALGVLNDLFRLYGPSTPFNFDQGFGYGNGDINMDGKVKYQGGSSGIDPLIILSNILGHPLNQVSRQFNFTGLVEQMP